MLKYLSSAILLAVSTFAAQAAKVDTVAVASKNIVSPAKVVVITPDSSDDTQRFPTVYILHGFSGCYSDWTKKRTDLPDLADKYGMVMVMPDGRDSWYWDSLNDSTMHMESYFTQELVPFIDANYPTLRDSKQRAITGLSMGGHGAMWYAMRHSDIWGNAGSMSGGVDIRPFTDRWAIKRAIGSYEEHPEEWEKHTVINLVPNLTPGQLNITFDCGVDDFFAGVNRDLHQALLDNKIPHDYSERPGKHSWDYWKNSILFHLLYFNEQFKKASNQSK